MCIFLERLRFGDIRLSGCIYVVFQPVVFFTKVTSLFRSLKSGGKHVTEMTELRENPGNVAKL